MVLDIYHQHQVQNSRQHRGASQPLQFFAFCVVPGNRTILSSPRPFLLIYFSEPLAVSTLTTPSTLPKTRLSSNIYTSPRFSSRLCKPQHRLLHSHSSHLRLQTPVPQTAFTFSSPSPSCSFHSRATTRTSLLCHSYNRYTTSPSQHACGTTK